MSDILQIKYAELLRRSGISVAGLQQFQDVVLDAYPTLREVIDTRGRSFDELLKLVDKSAGKFRRWIHNASPDANLVREYFKEVTQEGWISGLPAKAVRYVLGQAVSIAGLAMTPIAGLLAGAAFSASDTFFLERVIKGWRPSHFIEGNLRPFLRPDNGEG